MREHRLYRPKSVSLKARLRTVKKALLLCLFTALTLSMLLENEKALALSLTGLNLWFEKMIPTLLPFMILSGILIRMNLSDSFARLFAPLLRPLFGLSDSCLYVLVIGFLCGFPMGARVTAESLQHGRLTPIRISICSHSATTSGPSIFPASCSLFFPFQIPGRSGQACICSRCSTACFCAGHFTGIFRSAPGPPEQFPFQKPSRTSSVPLPFPQKAGQRFEMPAGRRLCWSRRRPPSPRRSFPSAPLAAI